MIKTDKDIKNNGRKYFINEYAGKLENLGRIPYTITEKIYMYLDKDIKNTLRTTERKILFQKMQEKGKS